MTSESHTVIYADQFRAKRERPKYRDGGRRDRCATSPSFAQRFAIKFRLRFEFVDNTIVDVVQMKTMVNTASPGFLREMAHEAFFARE